LLFNGGTAETRQVKEGPAALGRPSSQPVRLEKFRFRRASAESRPWHEPYSLNVTVVPQGPFSYLSLWPAGFERPLVSTLNSFDGRVVANAAIVPAGTNAINVFVTNPADVILDINGYFTP
jgi:hypothetical protein